MKAIIIGASLSGKTTLIKSLRLMNGVKISEIDEELLRLNNKVFPKDDDFRKNILSPKIFNWVLSQDDILFFTNTDYFSVEDLKRAKEQGFRIIQLDVPLEVLQNRNKYRVANEGYSDLSMWLEDMVEYQKELQSSGIVDLTLDGVKPTELIIEEVQEYLGF